MSLSLTVMIVDDEESIRDFLGQMVETWGYKVLSASSGHEAFHHFMKSKVDIVISDIKMPDGDGMELLEKIREQNKNIPFVCLITGLSDISEDEVIQKGANDLFYKPFDFNLLKTTIDSYAQEIINRKSAPPKSEGV